MTLEQFTGQPEFAALPSAQKELIKPKKVLSPKHTRQNFPAAPEPALFFGAGMEKYMLREQSFSVDFSEGRALNSVYLAPAGS